MWDAAVAAHPNMYCTGVLSWCVGCSGSSASWQCCKVNTVVLLAMFPSNVVELDAAAATHLHNVELEDNSTAV